MKNSLNLNEKILRLTKKHKKKNTLYTFIVLIIIIFLIFSFNIHKKTKVIKYQENMPNSIHLTYMGNITVDKNIKKVGIDKSLFSMSSLLKQSDFSLATLNLSDKPVQQNLNIISKLENKGVSSLNLTNTFLDTFSMRDLDSKIDKKINDNYVTGYGTNEMNSKVVTQEHKGKKIASINFVDIDSRYQNPNKNTSAIPLNPRTFVPLLEKLKKQNDLVIVNVDWGIPDEKNVTQRQKNFAHDLTKSGADIIIGQNNVVQKVEQYQGTPIFYSLGNTLSDDFFSKNKKGLIVQHEIKGSKNLLKLTPVKTRQGIVKQDFSNKFKNVLFENTINENKLKLENKKGEYIYEFEK